MDRLRRQIRRFTQPILWRVYKLYLSKTRWYQYDGLSIKVAPSVFHPGLLFSTKILLSYVLELHLEGKKILDLGAGSGLIPAVLARKGINIIATDINPIAVKSMQESRAKNKLDFEIIESDLFEKVEVQIFDVILINPPYFPKNPSTNREKAFFCGANFEYFRQLFKDVTNYTQKGSEIYMILSDDCAIETIQSFANSSIFEWELVHQQLIYGETNFIYRIKKIIE